jgi:hypothetical protein
MTEQWRCKEDAPVSIRRARGGRANHVGLAGPGPDGRGSRLLSFEGITGFSENVYLWNWLLVSAILFGASGVLFLVRLGRARRRVSLMEGNGK